MCMYGRSLIIKSGGAKAPSGLCFNFGSEKLMGGLISFLQSLPLTSPMCIWRTIWNCQNALTQLGNYKELLRSLVWMLDYSNLQGTLTMKWCFELYWTRINRWYTFLNSDQISCSSLINVYNKPIRDAS